MYYAKNMTEADVTVEDERGDVVDNTDVASAIYKYGEEFENGHRLRIILDRDWSGHYLSVGPDGNVEISRTAIQRHDYMYNDEQKIIVWFFDTDEEAMRIFETIVGIERNVVNQTKDGTMVALVDDSTVLVEYTPYSGSNGRAWVTARYVRAGASKYIGPVWATITSPHPQ